MTFSQLATSLIFATLSFTATLTAQSGPAWRVNEAQTQLRFAEGITALNLAVNYPAHTPQSVRVRAELLDTKDVARANAETTTTLDVSGASGISLTLPFSWEELKSWERDTVYWWRVRYTLTPMTPENAPPLLSGIFSVSQTNAQIFHLQLITPRFLVVGQDVVARVRAAHPRTKRPISGVKIAASLNLNATQKLEAHTVTDADGYAQVSFIIPPELAESEAKLTVLGQQDDVTQELNADLDFDRRGLSLVMTDKPLYQPGQTVQARLMMFGPQKNALAGRKIEMTVKDPEDEAIFSVTATTSEFGIASFAWPVAAATKLGSYRLEFKEETADDELITTSIKLSRYDLPTFTVTAQPDRAYYLAGQNATVTVRADYLFGQPVVGGQVRVVRETSREWNYETQKWDIEEAEPVIGTADAQGQVKLRLDLREFHDELKDSYSDTRFDDVEFIAYVTDPDTRRTEPRRFTVRVTREAMHVYYIGPDDYSTNANPLPLTFYLSAYYADGTPCRNCRITGRVTDDDGKPWPDGPRAPVLSATTNAYGLARVSDLTPPPAWAKQDDAALTFTARDAQGRTGRHTEEFYDSDDDLLQLTTAQTLHRRGEPITVNLVSTLPTADVWIDALSGSDSLTWRQTIKARLQNGRATVTVPYHPTFSNRVRLNATAFRPDSEPLTATRAVIYPAPSNELSVIIEPDRANYQPNQTAQLNFTVRQNDGTPARGVLGVVAIDRAVTERARAEGYTDSFGLPDDDAAPTIAGLSRRDFARASAQGQWTPDLDLAAEIALRAGWYGFESEANTLPGVRGVYEAALTKLVAPLIETLKIKYASNTAYPRNPHELQELAASRYPQLDALRDPWGQPLRYAFGTLKDRDTLSYASAGPDKQFDTDDDFTGDLGSWPYFRREGEALRDAVRAYTQRTGDYLPDATDLKAELRRTGQNFDVWRDRWGQPYRLEFSIQNYQLSVKVASNGPNRKPQTVYGLDVDDFYLADITLDYFARERAQIETALIQFLAQKGRYPIDLIEFRAALKASGQAFDRWRDVYKRPYFVSFDRQTRQQYLAYPPPTTNNNPPATPTLWQVITIFSPGRDGRRATADDFRLAVFSNQWSGHPSALPRSKSVGGVMLTGQVVDEQGAVVPNATLVATHQATQDTYSTVTDSDGYYALASLPAGKYTLRCAVNGFMPTVIEGVTLAAGQTRDVLLMLRVGGVMQTVDVSADVMRLETTSSSVGAAVAGQDDAQATAGRTKNKNAARPPLYATPRVRGYFPETLLWQPALETDAAGRAKLDFRFADNLTAWRFGVVASTKDGRVAVAETERTAFQPFFIEHNPPRNLTVGDTLELPIVARNYLETQQDAELSWTPAAPFAALGPTVQQTRLAARQSRRATFALRADAVATDAPLRFTARTAEAADAIEQPVTINPDGAPDSVADGNLLSNETVLQIVVPDDADPASLKGKVKIYPDLAAHLGESVKGLLRRPYGCGEQTISSTYPNLLILRYETQTGRTTAVHDEAAKNLQEGYTRLLNYRDATTGGFTYWGYGSADFALTAYAVRFLHAARDYVNVDAEILTASRAWLIKQQQPDGSWPVYDWQRREPDAPRTLRQTAYLARVLADTRPQGEPEPALLKALAYLRPYVENSDDVHFIASYALAAHSYQPEGFAVAAQRLQKLAHTEGVFTYWQASGLTPFYGWGQPAQFETTALAVRALGLFNNPEAALQAQRGLLYLLRNKDAYGVWQTTQTTINVLEAILPRITPPDAQQPAPVRVSVNDQPAGEILLSLDKNLIPLELDVSRQLRTGVNRITLTSNGVSAGKIASAQVATEFYRSWAGALAQQNADYTGGLSWAVSYDKTAAKIGAPIICTVRVARGNSLSRGMLLAEVGLPPGVEVDRAALETAQKPDAFQRYEIQPDKVVFYVWPRFYGPTTFSFKFRARMGLRAQTAPSVIYDYYNPTARVLVAPTRFVIFH